MRAFVGRTFEVSLVVESAVLAAGLTCAAIAAGTLAVVDERLLIVLIEASVAFVIGGLAWAVKAPTIPDAEPVAGDVDSLEPQRNIARSVVLTLPAVVIAVGIAAVAPRQYQGIVAGLYAAWALAEWRGFNALRRHENLTGLQIFSAGPFVPYRNRQTVIKPSRSDGDLV
jgi:hypothetical protein